MRKIFAAFAISSLLVAAGCDAGTGEDGDADGSAADGTVADAGGTDTTAGGDTTAADTAAAKTTYASIVIYDGSKTKPATCDGTGSGADIEAVALKRGGKFIAVGKPGSADYKESAGKCPDNKHAEADDIEAVTGAPGTIDTKAAENGYLSLGGGSVEVQFGACTGGGKDKAKDCDGKGDVTAIEDGDEVWVYEIGPTYKTQYSLFSGCKCLAEGFEVDARETKGASAASDNVLGGSNGDIASFTVKVPTK